MMTRIQFATLICCLSTSFTLLAQTPRNIVIDGQLRAPATGTARMECNDAGTITFLPFTGQSNDVSGDTIFMCFNDILEIAHQGGDLQGDPDAATPPGFGYAFYDCAPTQTGPDLATVLTDACLNTTSPITFPNGVTQTQDFGIWVATQDQDGDIAFQNSGALQFAFNNGSPVQLWFAPITLDNFANQAYENDGVGGPIGPCVDVNTDQAFSVVYLNEVVATNMAVTSGSTGCTGSFDVAGGLPEFIAAEEYDITISLASNPNIQGTVTSSSAPRHNSTVEFMVPRAGMYNIIVEDGKGCPAIFTMDFSTCAAVTFNFPLQNVSPGQQECLPVTVDNFNMVGSMQYSVTWDPAVLEFQNIQNPNPALTDLNNSINQSNNSTLLVSWFDAGTTGVTLGNGSVLFEMCFNVIGQSGETSPVIMTDTPLSIEVLDTDSNPYGVIVNGGQVTVSDSEMFVQVDPRNLTCSDSDDGGFTITAAGGTAPYSVSYIGPNGTVQGNPISTSGSSSTEGPLSPGIYQITVQDSGTPANVFMETIEIISPPSIGISLDDTQPSCNGESDGSVLAIVTINGVAQTDVSNYTFTWSTTTANVDRLENLPFGFYSVTVTDENNCTATASLTLSQPAPIVVTAANTFIQQNTCSGVNDGRITISATGGSTTDGNYTYSWDNGLGVQDAASADITGIGAGEYCVTITDDNGCVFSDCYVVGAVKTLTITESITDVSCFGETDGAIVLSGSTTPTNVEDLPYTFTWSPDAGTANDTQNSSSRMGLAAGTYSVTMADSDPLGCIVVETYTINEPDSISISIVDINNETCNDNPNGGIGQDGNISVDVTGGTGNYTYEWSHDTNLSGPDATGLSAGDYTLTVRDENDCTQTFNFAIEAPTPPNITSLTDDSVTCPNDTDGMLSVSATATAAPITGYLWSTGSTETSISNLTPGLYTVTVTASDNCQAVDTALVTSPGLVVQDSIDLRLPGCPGQNDGQIAVFVSGGTPPYSYRWSTNPDNPTTINPLPALAAGTYSVTVTDANNCTPLVIDNIVLNDPPTITVSLTVLAPVSCPDDLTCDGRVLAEASYSDGTTGTFDFVWSSGETELGMASSTGTQLCRGPQTLTVSDGTCGITVDVDVPSPDDFAVTADVANISCFGETDGTIMLATTGGTAPYDYLWDDGPSGSDRANLGAATYQVVITDANGCNITQTVPIAEPDELVLNINEDLSTPTISCAGENDGVIVVEEVGGNGLGTSPFTWSGGVAPAGSPRADNLAPGTYMVSVTDVRGCMADTVYTIGEPIPIIVNIQEPVPPLCFGDPSLIFIDTIFGGTGQDFLDFTYSVDNNGLNFPPNQPATVFGMDHVIRVSDPGGCTVDVQVSIPQPDEIIIDLETEITVELGDSVTLSPVISPLGGIFTYEWTPATSDISATDIPNPVVFPFRSEEYTLLITDPNGCTAEASVFIDLDANRNVYIPNAFSPDGDGINDEFRLFTCTGVRGVNFARVFDRWGEIVYNNDAIDVNCFDGSALWDGRKDGRTVSPGVYVYIIEVEFLDDVTLVFRGDVTVLR